MAGCTIFARRISCEECGDFYLDAGPENGPQTGGMMRIQLNGEPFEGDDSMTVADLLEKLDIQSPRVAVELNLDILPKDEYATTPLAEGDKLEVVHFVGGGKSQDGER